MSAPGDYNMAVARDRQHNSAAKSLLYGGGATDAPLREGKKSVPHARGAGAPFATYDAPPPSSMEQIKAGRGARKDLQGAVKVGAQDFDPEVYRNNRAANAANSAALKSKNWGSGAVMHSDQQQQQAPPAPPGGYSQAPYDASNQSYY